MTKNDKLTELMEKEDYKTLYLELKKIANSIGMYDDSIITAINALVVNGFLTEAQDILDVIFLPRDKRICSKILKNMIKDEKIKRKYDDETLEVYYTAIELGRDYYHEEMFEEAYYTYAWGLFSTDNPIFLYYIGKILYKTANYRDSEKYLREYLKHSADKTSKAYLYLANIERKKGHFDKSANYAEISNSLNLINGSDFFLEGYYDKKDEEVDVLKMVAQRKLTLDEEYFEKIIECDEFYQIRDAYIEGNIKLADNMFKDLISKEEKTDAEKQSISLIRKNRYLYIAKNRSN